MVGPKLAIGLLTNDFLRRLFTLGFIRQRLKAEKGGRTTALFNGGELSLSGLNQDSSTV